MDCGTKRDWSTVPKQYRCGSRLVPWQDYFGTDTVLEFLLGFFLSGGNPSFDLIISVGALCINKTDLVGLPSSRIANWFTTLPSSNSLKTAHSECEIIIF